MLTMTEADLRHLEDTSSPISDEERTQAAAEIRRLRALINAAEDQRSAMSTEAVQHG